MAQPQPDFITTGLNYAIDTALLNDTADHGALNQDTAIMVTKQVLNARKLQPRPPTLDSHGFQLVRHVTALNQNDFLSADETKIKTVYYGEVSALICAVTGAESCTVMHHMIRRRTPRQHGQGAKFEPPAAAIHCDYTAQTALSGFDSTCPPELKKRGNLRCIAVNVWRNIRDDRVIRNDHLAMCDATSVVAPDDFIPFSFKKPGDNHVLHTYRLDAGHAAQHKWYYYPDMAKNEALLFTQYDSDSRKYCRFTFHTAITDPLNASDDTRESIEMRAICYFSGYDIDTIPRQFLAGGADAVVRQGVLKMSQAASWLNSNDADDAGKTFLRAMLWSPGGREKVARWYLKEQIAPQLGLRGEKPTNEQLERIVAKVLEEGSEFLRTLVAALPRPDGEEVVRLVVAQLTNAVRPDIVAQHWDAGGKSWGRSCVARGACVEIAEGLVKISAEKGENGMSAATPAQQRQQILHTLKASREFNDNCRNAFKS